MNNLELLRAEIDEADKVLVNSVLNRMKLAIEAQLYKFDNNLPIEDKSREEEIYYKILKDLSDDRSIAVIKEIYSKIFNAVKGSNPNLSKGSLKEYLSRKPFVISGPCAVENEEQIDLIAKKMYELGIKIFRAGAFKPRTAPNSFQGTGEQGLTLAHNAAKKYNLFLVSEILDSVHLEKYHSLIDIIQIGSRNMASYELLKNVGKITAKDNKYVLLKRGFSATLKELVNAADYIRQEGNPNVILCLRGIRTFEQMDSKLRNTPDLASIVELKSMTDLPVCFDASHSTGNSDFVTDVAKAALILRADGLMIETHQNPESALIDGQQSIKPEELSKLLSFIQYGL